MDSTDPRYKLRLIANGFGTTLFAPDSAQGALRRVKLGWGAEYLVVGHAARLYPAKDHAGFLAAARLLAGRLPAACFLFIGQGMAPDNPALAACLEPPLLGHCALMVCSDDVPAWFTAMDVFAQSSLSEGLLNALGETLPSGLPVAATDAGDTRAWVGPAGRVGLPGHPYVLAEALEQLWRLRQRWRARAWAARSSAGNRATPWRPWQGIFEAIPGNGCSMPAARRIRVV
ncbi:hypothetical protein DFAR_3940004 [Desulfarculales bacterium]